jgi:UDP-N-acetylenolpyruvoylglucosamine reductase
MTPLENVRLAAHCTLGVGGPARFFVEAHDEAAVLEALDWARARRLTIRVSAAARTWSSPTRGSTVS